MDALEYRICKALNYITSITFPNNNIPPLKVTFMNKDTKSFHGDYNPKTLSARAGNLTRPPTHVLITLLHEGAHHCESIMTGQTGHQQSFYVIYNKLMITAIQMGLFTYEMAKTITDSSSVRQLEKYCGPVKETVVESMRYKKDKLLVYAFGAYSYKDTLRSRGYYYNSHAKAWEHEISKEKELEEKSFLDTLSSDITIYITSDMLDLTIFATILVTGNTYVCKDILSALNFTYRKIPGTKKSGWYKRVRSTQLSEFEKAKKILSQIPGVHTEISY